MAYLYPPTVARQAIVTNAVANTQTTSTVLAALGVGRSIRIVGYHAYLLQNATAGGIVRGSLFGGAILAGDFLHMVGGAMPTVIVPEPGIILPTNTPLQVNTLCTVATQTLIVVAYYYNDPA